MSPIKSTECIEYTHRRKKIKPTPTQNSPLNSTNYKTIVKLL